MPAVHASCACQLCMPAVHASCAFPYQTGPAVTTSSLWDPVLRTDLRRLLYDPTRRKTTVAPWSTSSGQRRGARLETTAPNLSDARKGLSDIARRVTDRFKPSCRQLCMPAVHASCACQLCVLVPTVAIPTFCHCLVPCQLCCHLRQLCYTDMWETWHHNRPISSSTSAQLLRETTSSSPSNVAQLKLKMERRPHAQDFFTSRLAKVGRCRLTQIDPGLIALGLSA